MIEDNVYFPASFQSLFNTLDSKNPSLNTATRCNSILYFPAKHSPQISSIPSEAQNLVKVPSRKGLKLTASAKKHFPKDFFTPVSCCLNPKEKSEERPIKMSLFKEKVSALSESPKNNEFRRTAYFSTLDSRLENVVNMNLPNTKTIDYRRNLPILTKEPKIELKSYNHYTSLKKLPPQNIEDPFKIQLSNQAPINLKYERKLSNLTSNGQNTPTQGNLAQLMNSFTKRATKIKFVHHKKNNSLNIDFSGLLPPICLTKPSIKPQINICNAMKILKGQKTETHKETKKITIPNRKKKITILRKGNLPSNTSTSTSTASNKSKLENSGIKVVRTNNSISIVNHKKPNSQKNNNLLFSGTLNTARNASIKSMIQSPVKKQEKQKTELKYKSKKTEDFEEKIHNVTFGKDFSP